MKGGGLTSLAANQTVSAAATVIVGCSFTAPANSFVVGQVYRLRFEFQYVHTAATTPTLTVAVRKGGATLTSLVVTPVATAATYHGYVEAYFTVRAAGVSGTITTPSIHVRAVGLTAASADGGSSSVPIVTTAVDTTAAATYDIAINMTTAVGSNTLTISQGWVERVVP